MNQMRPIFKFAHDPLDLFSGFEIDHDQITFNQVSKRTQFWPSPFQTFDFHGRYIDPSTSSLKTPTQFLS